MVCVRLLFCMLLHLSLTIVTIIQGAPSDVPQPICYRDIGCYLPRPGSDIYPESPDTVNTRFFLYTRDDPIQAEAISASDLGSFESSKPIKLIIHGYNDQATNQWVVNMTQQLLKSEDMNVITVDWSGRNKYLYDQAVANTVIAAAVIRQLLQVIINTGAQPEQIHLIGHSLGAHISSYVGREFPNLGRISGLDPAGLGFYQSEIADRLDSSDALFVDVIHTDSVSQVVPGFGYLDTLGDVDFYPNGGSAQPTCDQDTDDMSLEMFWYSVSGMDMEDGASTVACNHMAAVFYYTDSINTHSPAFAYPCADYKSFVYGLCTSCGPDGNHCQKAGYHASPDRTLGTLYLMTLDGIKPPHFGFHFKVTLESNMKKGLKTRGIVKIKFNQQEEDAILFDQDTLIEWNFSGSKTILIANNPIPLNEISVPFRKSDEIDSGVGFAVEWRFNSVTILDMQSNIEYTFCLIADISSKIIISFSWTYQPCVQLKWK